MLPREPGKLRFLKICNIAISATREFGASFPQNGSFHSGSVHKHKKDTAKRSRLTEYGKLTSFCPVLVPESSPSAEYRYFRRRKVTPWVVRFP
jgi:hypothetical protein